MSGNWQNLLEMRIFICVLWLATLVASDALTQTQREDLLKCHNDVRSNVNPEASKMMELVGCTCLK